MVGQYLQIIVVCLLAPLLLLWFCRRSGALLTFSVTVAWQVCTGLWSLLGPAVQEYK